MTQPKDPQEHRVCHISSHQFFKKEWQTVDENGFYELVYVIDYSAYQALQSKLEKAEANNFALKNAIHYQIEKYNELNTKPSDLQIIEMLGDKIDDLFSKLKKAEAENKRLREALQAIDNTSDCKFALEIVDEALKGEGE